jgi:hypothetical protein
MLRRTAFILIAFILAAAPASLRAQGVDDFLTAKEVEQLRDSAYFPDQRVLVFVGFINDRVQALDALFAKPRRPGREQDTHDLIAQINAISGECEDNLLEYRKQHRDLRKVLPKLVSATERWASSLKGPADDPHYSLTRKLALDSVRDLRDDATEMVPEQKAWFAAHPPPKHNNEPFEIN